MILDDKIKVKINKQNIEHFSRFYKVELKNIIEIEPIHLQSASNLKINVQCDICETKRIIAFQSYYKNINSCKRYPIYTCDRCSHIKLKETNKEKYGCEYYSQHPDKNEKMRKTSLERYGAEHFSKSKYFHEKVDKTNLEKFGYINPFMDKDRIKSIFKDKYGVEHPSQVYEFNRKIKQSNLDRHGYEEILSSPEIRLKIKETNLERYGNASILKTELFRANSNMKISNDKNYIKYINNNISEFNCDKGHTFEMTSDDYHNRTRSNISLCTVCNPIGENRSIKEKDLYEYIRANYKGEIITSYRDKLEIDIYLPELKIGFEFNGLYWHSEEYKTNSYHLDKTNYFNEKGIRIIHIWEDDWSFKETILKSQINNLLNLNSEKIFARKCIIKEVDVKIARYFLDNNHIQGKVNSTKKIGLYYTVTQSNGVTNNELVSIMTFDQSEGRKKMEEGGYNLSRFCNKLGYNVVGGASKLLSYFIKEYNPSRIISYADKDWSIGSLYYTLGFENVGGNGPDYKYIVDNKRVHKSRYKKSKLKTIISESKAMKELGINRIYDCGKIKFEKVL